MNMIWFMKFVFAKKMGKLKSISQGKCSQNTTDYNVVIKNSISKDWIRAVRESRAESFFKSWNQFKHVHINFPHFKVYVTLSGSVNFTKCFENNSCITSLSVREHVFWKIR